MAMEIKEFVGENAIAIKEACKTKKTAKPKTTKKASPCKTKKCK